MTANADLPVEAADAADADAPTAPGFGRGERPQVVYAHLRAMIVSGRLPPGGPLIVTDIAERMGVSRTPIHAALLRLHQEGFIVDAAEPRVFKYVTAPLTRSDAQSLFDIMAELEGLAAHDAAMLPGADQVRLAEALADINARLWALAGTPGSHSDQFCDLDKQFHKQVSTAGGNPRLLTLLATVDAQVERYWRAYAMRRADAMSTSAMEHDRIIAALAAGDRDAAQTAMRTNWRSAAGRLLPAIALIGERGHW